MDEPIQSMKIRALGSFEFVFLEKFPHEVVGGNVQCGFAEKVQHRLPAGPGVATSFYGDPNDFRAILTSASAVGLAAHLHSIALFGKNVGLRLLVTDGEFHPGLHRVFHALKPQEILDASLALCEWHQIIFGPVKVDDRYGLCWFAFSDGNGPVHGCDGGNSIRQLCGQPVTNHAVVAHAAGIYTLGVHLDDGAKLVKQLADEGNIVCTVFGQQPLESADIPDQELAAASTIGINDDEPVFVRSFI